MTEPDWDGFKVIRALGRAGSVAGAARSLGVDSSTVSRRLAAIEEALGAVLIVRGGRGFAFTTEGHLALEVAETVEARITAACTAIRAAKTRVEGKVHLSVVPGLLHIMFPFHAAVMQRHPDLTLEISADIRTLDIARGETDIAMRMRRPTEPDLITGRSFVMGMGLYASKDYIARHGLPAGRQELKNHRLLLFSQEFAHLPHFNWLEPLANPDEAHLRVDGVDMAYNLALAGVGIGLCDCYRGDASPDLVRVLPEAASVTPGWIVYHESARDTPRVKAVVGMLGDYLDGQRGRLSGALAG